jgi:hypothetical protein
METIIFYSNAIEMGRADLPMMTDTKERWKIAKGLGLTTYSRVQFLRDDGTVRVDSDSYKNRSIFDKELNKKIK